MEKRIINENYFFCYASDFDGETLKENKELFEKCITDFGEDAILDYDYDTTGLTIKTSRLETDIEFEARLKREAEESERKIAEEKKLYEKLKAKYGL